MDEVYAVSGNDYAFDMAIVCAACLIGKASLAGSSERIRRLESGGSGGIYILKESPAPQAMTTCKVSHERQHES